MMMMMMVESVYLNSIVDQNYSVIVMSLVGNLIRYPVYLPATMYNFKNFQVVAPLTPGLKAEEKGKGVKNVIKK